MIPQKSDIQRIQKIFSERARTFSIQEVALTDLSHLRWIIHNFKLQNEWNVLEVASASGHMTRAIAPHVHHITALDATPNMLQEAEKVSKLLDISNIDYCQGLAQAMPFQDNTFDFVTSRFLMHHIADRKAVLKEMIRVCKPGGKIAVVDWIVPEEDTLAKNYNRLEKMRDATHLSAMKNSEFKQLMAMFQWQSRESFARDVEICMQEWFLLAKTSPQNANAIQQEFLEEFANQNTTGMRPFIQDNIFYFYQIWAIEIGIKPNS